MCDFFGRFRSSTLPFEEPRKYFSAIGRTAARFVLLLLQNSHLRAQQTRLLDQSVMALARFVEIFRAVSRQNQLADEIEQQPIKNLEAVRIVYEVSQKNVMLQKQMIVVPSIHKQEPVLQQRINLVEILAKKRAPRFRKRALFHVAPDPAQRLAHLP